MYGGNTLSRHFLELYPNALSGVNKRGLPGAALSIAANINTISLRPTLYRRRAATPFSTNARVRIRLSFLHAHGYVETAAHDHSHRIGIEEAEIILNEPARAVGIRLEFDLLSQRFTEIDRCIPAY